MRDLTRFRNTRDRNLPRNPKHEGVCDLRRTQRHSAERWWRWSRAARSSPSPSPRTALLSLSVRCRASGFTGVGRFFWYLYWCRAFYWRRKRLAKAVHPRPLRQPRCFRLRCAPHHNHLELDYVRRLSYPGMEESHLVDSPCRSSTAECHLPLPPTSPPPIHLKGYRRLTPPPSPAFPTPPNFPSSRPLETKNQS